MGASPICREPTLVTGERNTESLVDIGEYGIAGQSYYSRQNAATGEPLKQASTTILLRRSIVERLADINYALQQSNEVTELLGGEVELYVDEGLRTFEVQSRLYNDVFPSLIRKQNPDWNEQQVRKRRDQLVAKPTLNAKTPAPHATGAAFDISLRYTKPSLGFTKGARVDFGHMATDLSFAANPDFFEDKTKLTKAELRARQNRRVFYWVMRGALIQDDSGFVVNPNEFWHWSYGDQMWATLSNAPYAFFGLPPE